MTYLVIPCYNEATRFNKKVFFSYFNLLENVGFIFVNDGSTDATQSLLETIQSECKEGKPNTAVVLLHLEKNVGKAEAVRQGIFCALENPETTYVSYFDADFSTPLSELDALRSAMEKDPQRKAVFGSRIKKAGSHIERSQIRHYLGRILATVVNNSILKIAIYDTQCGAKLFTRACAQEIFTDPFVSRWLFDIELITRLQIRHSLPLLNTIIYEQPLTVWKETGNSKIRLTDLAKIPYELFIIYRKQKNDYEKNISVG